MTPRTLLWLSPEGFHRLCWSEWGTTAGHVPPVICVHGLTRTGRDFDALADALAARGRRVLCPDMPGRGRSDWLGDPSLYRNDIYASACAHLLATLGEGPVDWVGTSMGGLIGMILAAAPRTPIRRLVLNDVGAAIPAAALARIGEYLGRRLHFPDLAAAEAHLRRVHAPFGTLPDSVWRHLTETSMVPTADGLVPHYDPAIAVAFAANTSRDADTAQDIDLWPLWNRVQAETLLLRGEDSDLLTLATAERMAAAPHVRLVTIPGCGHAPALFDPAQIDIVVRFLEEGP